MPQSGHPWLNKSSRLWMSMGLLTLDELLESVVDLMGGPASDQGLQLNCELDESLSAPVVVDKGRLKQVLFNLVNNAIKFTVSGSVTIAASAHEGTGLGLAISRRLRRLRRRAS